MASEGPNSPATVVNDDNIGNVYWDDPGNAAAEDGTFAAATISDETLSTVLLKASDFGFSIPSDATVDGITVEVKASTDSGTATWNSVKVSNIGEEESDDKAAGTITASLAYATFGGAADLWGQTYAPADINDSGFAAILQVRFDGVGSVGVNIDHVRMTVTYTEVGGGGSAVSTSLLLGVG
jgi:hypothetical protein